MQPRRRWFQFRLRSLLIAMLVFSVGLGFYLPARRKAQEQWEAVREFREAGGILVLERYRLVSGDFEAPFWKRWLRINCPPYKLAQIYVFEEMDKSIVHPLGQLPQLEDIFLFGVPLNQQDMKDLSDLPNLWCLEVTKGRGTDDGILCFAGHRSLQKLDWAGEGLTNRGMAVVAQLPELRELSWFSKNTTDEGLVHLRDHPQLTMLTIPGRMATDAGFTHLGSCTNLICLKIRGTNSLTNRGIGSLANLRLKQITFWDSPLSKDAMLAMSDLTTLESLRLTGDLSAEDLASLSALTSLEYLAIEDCKLTGEGLKKLAPLTQLKELQVNIEALNDDDMELLASFSSLSDVKLKGSSITDVGLLRLAKMKGLKKLKLIGTRVTAGGVDSFHKLSPSVSIYYE